jgi:hypothetical protein
LQHIIEKQLEARHTGKDYSLDRIEKSLSNNKTQIDNIVDAISQGIKVDTVLERVKQLDAERDRLIHEKDDLEKRSIRKDDVKALAKTISKEVHNFEHAFDSASFFEKKNWIRQFVLKILIDRKKNRALCYTMKIPMVSHPVMTALLPSESTIKVVAGCAGSRHTTAGCRRERTA